MACSSPVANAVPETRTPSTARGRARSTSPRRGRGARPQRRSLRRHVDEVGVVRVVPRLHRARLVHGQQHQRRHTPAEAVVHEGHRDALRFAELRGGGLRALLAHLVPAHLVRRRCGGARRGAALLSSSEPEPELGSAQPAWRARKTARASLPRAGRSQAELMKRLDRSGGARRACAPGAPAVSSLAGARGFDGTSRATRSPARAGTSFGELWDRTAAALRIGAAHRRRAKKLALGPPELQSCIRR